MKPNFRKRFFAWMMKKSDATSDVLYGHYKEELFSGVRGSVVEIGPGSGVNFKYLSSSIEWIGIEPNEAFHKDLLKKAKQEGIKAQLLQGDVLHIPLPDNYADAIVCTLVLCSVTDTPKAIEEMKRVLKPGARLCFIEHVAAPKRTLLRLAQNVFNPMNRMIADGCNCNRETWTYFQQGRFKHLELSHHKLKGTLPFFSPHVIGYGIK